MSFSISGKTAIVTGAASGIGLAIGRQLANAGANVMFVDTNEAALLAELGEQADDSNIRYFVGDMRERLAVANLLSATIDAFDEIDILVNGARQVVTSDPLDPQDETVEQLLQQNLMTAMRLSQQVAKRMIRQSEDREDEDDQVGTIINLSSISARRTHPDLLAYSVASAALDQMTRSMAVALGAAPHPRELNRLWVGDERLDERGSERQPPAARRH